MERSDLETLAIQHWDNIKSDWQDADLLLGNGFSIRLSASLHYHTLFEHFLRSLGDAESTRFRSFQTSNFEAIQRRLLDTRVVNELFGLPTESLSSAITQLRDGLIRTIEDRHPRAEDIDKDLMRSYALALVPFSDVFTLNYDLFIYLIIMATNDVKREGLAKRGYNDFFWAKSADGRYCEFRDHQGYPYDHVFYLHGALFIFPGRPEIKLLRRDEEELIEVIAERIRGGGLPVFVSEGSADEKWLSIASSEYLRFAQRALIASREKIVIYGASLGDADTHVVESLGLMPRQIAVSIQVANKTSAEIAKIKRRYDDRLTGHKLTFFDADTLFPQP